VRLAPRAVLAAVPALLALPAVHACAQPVLKSQPGSVGQTIAHTRIDITYHRPVARGRDLFGALVPYGRVWSPSADTAALFTTSTSITINGAALPAGTYSLFALPGAEQWTFIFSRSHPTFHLAYHEGNDALRVEATPRPGVHVETLAFYFPMVDADSAELVLHWGRTVVPMTIKAP
jgi:Protein of unknown function (DUF2911)